MSDSKQHSEPTPREEWSGDEATEPKLSDFIDMDAYDVVAGETHRRLVEQLEAMREALTRLVAANHV